MERITRKAAKAAGLKHYFTGKPCKRSGHIDRRYVAQFTCVTCAREKAKETWDKRDADKRKPSFEIASANMQEVPKNESRRAFAIVNGRRRIVRDARTGKTNVTQRYRLCSSRTLASLNYSSETTAAANSAGAN
jgi:hypothetical protein